MFATDRKLFWRALTLVVEMAVDASKPEDIRS